MHYSYDLDIYERNLHVMTLSYQIDIYPHHYMMQEFLFRCDCIQHMLHARAYFLSKTFKLHVVKLNTCKKETNNNICSVTSSIKLFDRIAI